MTCPISVVSQVHSHDTRELTATVFSTTDVAAMATVMWSVRRHELRPSLATVTTSDVTSKTSVITSSRTIVLLQNRASAGSAVKETQFVSHSQLGLHVDESSVCVQQP